MILTRFRENARPFYAAAVILISAVVLLYLTAYNEPTASANDSSDSVEAAPTATFPGTNTGDIPDGLAGTPPQFGAPRTVNFAVSGISAPITNVDVNMTISHSWVGDVDVVLAAPGGSPSMVVVSRIGVTIGSGSAAFGDSSNYFGTYTFDDSAAGTNIWTVATNAACGDTCDVAAGSYRTTAPGQPGQSNPPAVTSLNSTFSSLTPAQANGTWTLTFRDAGADDVGSVTAANLIIDTGPAVVTDRNVDFNGDNRSDYVVARATTTPIAEALALGRLRPGRPFYSSLEERPVRTETVPAAENLLAPPIYWYIFFNGPGNTAVGPLGDAATDFLTPEDFDGDNKDDLAVWTEAPATQANFKVLHSTTNTVVVTPFGQTDDDPAIVGDYDGDNKADHAVFRCPPASGADGQCFFFYRGSLNNPSGNITYIPWGFGTIGDFFPYVGDLDGDAKHDFTLQRAHPTEAGKGQFVLLRSSNFAVEYINWGNSSDFLVPGDYDGNGMTDICVRRTVGSSRHHWILFRGTGTTQFTQWGVVGDQSAPGDYDGDGKTDLAIWRPNVDPTQNYFWVLNSSNGSVTVFEWGMCPSAATGDCDFAVAGWAVH